MCLKKNKKKNSNLAKDSFEFRPVRTLALTSLQSGLIDFHGGR